MKKGGKEERRNSAEMNKSLNSAQDANPLTYHSIWSAKSETKIIIIITPYISTLQPEALTTC